jgi:hypothetical protein
MIWFLVIGIIFCIAAIITLSVKLVRGKHLSATGIVQDRHNQNTNKKMKNILSFDILKNNNKITFRKIELNQLEGNRYREINGDIIKSGLSNAVAVGGQMAAISALNPNGLFSATVNPQLLTLFSDGTVSTMIHGSAGIAGHAGFVSVSATVFAPIAVMQLMSMITGQYYMNGIAKQMNSIDKKIDTLILLHHTEKVSKLEYAQKIIKDLSAIEYPSFEHLTQLKNIEYEIGSIFTEYTKYLENIDGSSVSHTDFHWFSENKMKQLLNNVSESSFAFKMYMVITADELLHFIKIIELSLNIKIQSQQENRNNQINEIYETISKWDENDFYAYRYGKKILENYYDPILEKANAIKQGPFFHEDERKNKMKLLTDQRKSSEGELFNLFSLEIKEKLVEQMETPVEVIYSINNNETKLLVKQ